MEMMNGEGYLKKLCMKIGEGVWFMMLYIAKRVDKGQAQRGW